MWSGGWVGIGGGQLEIDKPGGMNLFSFSDSGL